jgi:hypothetical protein
MTVAAAQTMLRDEPYTRKLGCDEEVGERSDEAGAHGLRRGGADGVLRAVERGRVEVAVAEAHGVEHCGRQVLRRARRAGAEAQHGHRVPRVERHAGDAHRHRGPAHWNASSAAVTNFLYVYKTCCHRFHCTDVELVTIGRSVILGPFA